ncbi:MAG: AMP-binding protein, partial [Bradyrhizobium sp.]
MSANEFSLQSLITRTSAADPAFVFDGAAASRIEFAANVEQTAAWLAAQGIGRGDVVAVWLVNRVEWIALLFAAARLGAVAAAVNTRYRSAEVAPARFSRTRRRPCSARAPGTPPSCSSASSPATRKTSPAIPL